MNQHILREASDAALYKEQRDKLARMLRKVLVHAELYSEDCGGCDHSVGICSCELRNDIEDAHALLSEAS